MQFFVYLNDAPQGPFTREELIGMNLTPMTPVWYEGLPDWMPAGVAPQTAPLFSPRLTNVSVSDSTAAHTAPATGASTSNAQSAYQTATATNRPRSYLIGSIIVTVLGFTLAGIVAVFLALRTRSALRYGDYGRAERLSEQSQLWIIIAIVLGMVSAYFQTMMMLGSGSAAM